MKIGVAFGISRPRKDNGDFSGGFYPVEISCFGSGVWLMDKKFKFDTKWKMSKQ